MTPAWTIGAAVNSLTAQFAARDIDTPRLDARLLVGHVLGLEPSALFARADTAISDAQVRAIEGLAARRLRFEPVSRILGYRAFWGLTFKLNAAMLDPRPDTETVVEAALALKDWFAAPPQILDLGTGSGCILLAILSEWSAAEGLGIDQADEAVSGAAENAARLGLEGRARFQTGNWCEGLSQTFDLIVSNPPYIAHKDAGSLAPDVAQYDPAQALFGGEDGLEAYRALIPGAYRHLRPGGYLILEIGIGQAEAVEALLIQYGFALESRVSDLGGRIRVLTARSAPAGEGT